MTPKEKIDRVKEIITEEAEIRPSGSFYFEFFSIRDIEANDGIPDEAPVLLSRKECWLIMQKLNEEGFIQNLRLDEKGRGAWLELTKKENLQSAWLTNDETTNKISQPTDLPTTLLSKSINKNENKIIIKNIRLVEQKYMLEINNGENNVSFRSKKGKVGLEKETKLYKLLYCLWEFRREIGRNSSAIKKGDWTSIKNLTIHSGSKEKATYKNIGRLSEKLKNYPIKIENDKAGKYRLLIKIN